MADHDNWFLRHSLSLLLVVILVAQSLAYHFALLPDGTSEQAAHGDTTALWPSYWLHYASEWFVSVLADTYGALVLVLVTKWFYEQGSEESGGRGQTRPSQAVDSTVQLVARLQAE